MRRSIYKGRTGVEKVRTIIHISRSLWERVEQVAPEIYGIHRGAISYAVEDALKHWLALHLEGRINPHQGIRECYNAVMNEVRKYFDLLIPSIVSTEMLLKCVMKALDVKDRSAQSWIYKFYMEELIKPLSPEPLPQINRSSDVKRIKVWEIVAKEA
ncbi:MAG: hypothetical protein QXU81_00060 [Candidatus Bathyarchaeia archaeon]